MRMLKTLVLAASLASTAAIAVPKVGEPAPAFTATDSNGKTVQLSDFKGKFVVLEWSNNECPFVKKHYSSGNMQSLQKEETGKGVTWLTVISSAPGKQGNVDGKQANALSKERGAVPTAVLLDPSGKLGHEYEAKTTPHMFVVDPKGTLVYMGGIDSVASADAEDIAGARPYVKVALAEAMAGKPVTDAVTKPYGCSVKY
ncbi:thioredoxin family protein [Solimonas sp. K1W22B-7]|uniref:thioredoxin family protein n=1 Tax=Solimonas sp. K1W22B-7 TaxID=2303331 RepID=UPI000E32FF36|nr:thioredoxin family protein [Solimonas sp. K1W22B-7]AXQ30989.1 thioredoxin family protein [Solimonas sp. K1W22B-7]